MILLYNPPSSSGRKPILPCSLLALGALLEGKHAYEIVDGNDRALDPLKVHELKRRTVPEASKEAFAAEMDRLRAKLDQEVAETITPAPAAGAQ